MDKKINTTLNLNLYLASFILLSGILRISYSSLKELTIRFFIIIVCIIVSSVLNHRSQITFYENGIAKLLSPLLILTIIWVILKVLAPEIAYLLLFAPLLTIIIYFCQYQGYYYHEIENERLPIYALIFPIIIIIGSFLILMLLGEKQKAFTALIVTSIIYFSFRMKKIVRWRQQFFFVVFIAIVIAVIYLYKNDVSINLKVTTISHGVNLSLLGKGIGHSELLEKQNFTFNSLNLALLLIDELGVFGFLYLNFTASIIIYLLFIIKKMVKDAKETYRLFVIAVTYTLLSETVIFNLVLLNIIQFNVVNFPFIPSSYDFIWWSVICGIVLGLLKRQQSLSQLSP